MNLSALLYDPTEGICEPHCPKDQSLMLLEHSNKVTCMSITAVW